ncbi:MAG: hypothetical protein KC445_21365, partial [Anaerolineales bacterium]|nr:hypothetical protein [Anaerolineales bacterium]
RKNFRDNENTKLPWKKKTYIFWSSTLTFLATSCLYLGAINYTEAPKQMICWAAFLILSLLNGQLMSIRLKRSNF